MCPCCGIVKKKEGECARVGGGSVVSTGHMVTFKDHDHNGPVDLFHCVLCGEWNFGRHLWLLVSGKSDGSHPTENGARSPALNHRHDGMVIHITNQSTQGAFKYVQ